MSKKQFVVSGFIVAILIVVAVVVFSGSSSKTNKYESNGEQYIDNPTACPVSTPAPS